MLIQIELVVRYLEAYLEVKTTKRWFFGTQDDLFSRYV